LLKEKSKMNIVLRAEKREVFGKNASRRMRRGGLLPVILYGSVEPSIPLTVKKQDIFEILKSETGENTIFQIVFDSVKKDAMIKQLQRDPVSDEILHADLIQIAMDKAIRVSVPVVLVGEAVGVKAEGGFVDFVTREIEMECLPRNIPENIEVDISDLHLHQSLKIGDVASPEGAEFTSDMDAIVVLVEAPTKEEEIEVEEEEEVIAEEEEPEVIKKEKEEAEKEEKVREEKEEKEGKE
jgi:large subunit ribosomal protein L25